MLRLVCANKTYKSKRGAPCHALKDVHVTLGDTGMYFILGKSGSGKSTLLNVLGGLDRVDSGEVYYNDRPFSSFSEKEFEGYRNNVVGFIFQEYNLMENFDVYANVSLALRLQGEKNKEVVDAAVAEALATVELSGYEKRSVNELSGGQQQRVAIARAIVKQSSILLADEPTGNLDSETGADIFALLKKISENKLVIVVSHDRESAEAYGDGIIEIKDGEVLPSPFTTPNEHSEQTEPAYAQTTLTGAKLPRKYMLGLATRNLLQKKFKSLLTILSTIFMIVFICGMHVFYTIDANRNIALSAQNTGVQYFSMKQAEETDYGLNLYSSIENYAVYDAVKDAPNVRTAIGYDVDLPLSSLYQFYEVTERNEEGMVLSSTRFNIEVTKAAYLIESKADLRAMGIPLYEGAASDDFSGVYLSDVAVRDFLRVGYAFADGTTDYAKMGGKVLSVPNSENTYYVPISGVIRTGLIDHLLPVEGFKNTTLELKRELTLAERNAFAELTSAAFMTEELYVNHFAPNPLDPQKIDVFTFTYGREGETFTAKAIREYVPHGMESSAFVLSQAGVSVVLDPDARYSLSEGEVLLPVNTYNLLFPDDKIDCSGIDFEDLQTLPTLTARHLGEKINLSVQRKTVNRNLLTQPEFTVTGVLFADNPAYLEEKNAGYLYLQKGVSEELLHQDFLLLGNNNNLLLTYSDAEDLGKVLTLLREDYGVAVANSYYFAEIFYKLNDVFQQIANVFLLLFLFSLFVSVLLLINLISFSVTARKKEIGILKALGTGNFDLKKIFIVEAMILGGIALLVGAGGTVWLVEYANSLITYFEAGMIFFAATPATYLLMAVMTLVVMPLLAFLPLYRITKLNPVDAIKK